MAIQLSVAVRNAALDAIETSIGATAVLKMRTGAAPVNCAAADSGTVVASMTLPADWMAAASSGSKALLGSWADSSADAGGTIGHFRVYDSGGTVCGIQGTVTATGGGGDIEISPSATVSLGDTVTVTAFTLTGPNA